MDDKDRPTIYAVDFDGTIVENDFPDIGPINLEVQEFIVNKKRDNNIIILWTTRQNEKLEEALRFCEEHGIPIDYTNRNVPWIDFATSDKIFADVYVDDRSYNPFNNNLDSKVKLTMPDDHLRTESNDYKGGKEGMSDIKPTTFEESIEEITEECDDLLISKQKDYGPKNILSFGELGVLVRANDKLERLKHNLWEGKVENGEDIKVENESIEDSWADLRNYAQIALMVRRGQFDLPLKKDK